MITETNRKIHAALNTLMEACGFQGESGTEALFDALAMAVGSVENDWHIVDQSHADGLCYDVNSMLANALVKALTDREMLLTPNTSQEHPVN